MKTSKKSFLAALAIIAIIAGCKKEEKVEYLGTTNNPHNNTDNYESLSKFYSVNGVPVQTFTITAENGGTFTTPQGTVVTIPANAFRGQTSLPVTGTVTIEFKDIYKKSDMLLSNMGTSFASGPLKSGGEFFIKATANGEALLLAPGKKVEIIQPLEEAKPDSAMRPWILNDVGQWDGVVQDTAQVDSVFGGPFFTDIDYTASNYVFSLYQFSSPADKGTWCNSDNSTYFDAYTKTTLTLNPLDNPDEYYIDVFLVFTDINSMVHVYRNGANFPYAYAPVGLKCTVVAIGLKEGKIYSSFKPITITNNLTVDFKLSETTTEEFVADVKALN